VIWLALALAADCASCHGEEAYAHGQSRHGQAFTNPSFQTAWARHRDPWCLSCHQREGVGCEDCHGEDAAMAHPTAGDLPHPVEHTPDLGTSACRSCHDFSPPGSTVLLQATVSEHVPSTGSCAGCHMPAGDHTLRGARDQAFVREALSVTWDGPEATVRAQGAGHAVPTGDPFRQLLLEVGSGEEVLDRARFGRAVEGVGASFRVVSDTRIPAPGPDGTGARTVRLDAPTATWWRLRFELVDPAHTELEGLEAGWTVEAGALPSSPAAR